MTSPPLTEKDLTPEVLEGHDYMYFRLHGLVATPDIWYGEGADGNWVPGFLADNLAGVDLGGAVVVLANCFSMYSAVLPKLIQSGASAVLAGPGRNFAATGGRVVGVDLLAQWVLRGLERGWGIRRSLLLAKSRLLLSAWRSADKDALEFTLIRG